MRYTTTFFVLVIGGLVYFWIRRTYRIIFFQPNNSKFLHKNQDSQSSTLSYASQYIEKVDYTLDIEPGGFVMGKEIDGSETIHLKIDLYKPKIAQKNLPVVIWFNNDLSDEFCEVLKTLSYEGNFFIFSLPFTISNETELNEKNERLKYFNEFMEWSIIHSFDFNCDFNNIIIGGDGYGGFISVLFSFFHKNNYKYSPGWSGQIIINPKLYNFKIESHIAQYKRFEYKKHLLNFIQNEQNQFPIRGFKTPMLYMKTAIYEFQMGGKKSMAEKDRKKIINYIDLIEKDGGYVKHYIDGIDGEGYKLFNESGLKEMMKDWLADESSLQKKTLDSNTDTNEL